MLIKACREDDVEDGFNIRGKGSRMGVAVDAASTMTTAKLDDGEEDEGVVVVVVVAQT